MPRRYSNQSGLLSGLGEVLSPSNVTEYDFDLDNFEYKVDVDVNRPPADMNQLTAADWIPLYQRSKYGAKDAPFVPVKDKWNGNHVHLYVNAAIAFKRMRDPNAANAYIQSQDAIFNDQNDVATPLNLPVVYYKRKGTNNWQLARNGVTDQLIKPPTSSMPILDQVIGNDRFELIKHGELINSGISYSHWVHQRWVDQSSVPNNSAYNKADVMQAYQNAGVTSPFGNGNVVNTPPTIVNNPNGVTRTRTQPITIFARTPNPDVAPPPTSPALVAPPPPQVIVATPPTTQVAASPPLIPIERDNVVITQQAPTTNPANMGYNPNQVRNMPTEIMPDEKKNASAVASVAGNNFVWIGVGILALLVLVRK